MFKSITNFKDKSAHNDYRGQKIEENTEFNNHGHSKSQQDGGDKDAVFHRQKTDNLADGFFPETMKNNPIKITAREVAK